MCDDDSVPCIYGHHKSPFRRYCHTWFCPRCHRANRAKYANLLLTDFQYRSDEWFDNLFFAVFRPCQYIQDASFGEGIHLAVAVYRRFLALLRETAEFAHFSLTHGQRVLIAWKFEDFAVFTLVFLRETDMFVRNA